MHGLHLHRSDSHRCFNWPIRYGQPTQLLETFRNADNREYQALALVKAAEEKAATLESNGVIKYST